jgi:hypothetical protein
MTKVGTQLATAVPLGKRLIVALAAGAAGVGLFAAPASAEPTGGPGEPTCQAAIVSGSAQGSGRRAVAESFFGDDPTAVQVAERAVQEFCASV